MKLRVTGKKVEWDGGSLELSIPVLDAIRLGDRILVVHDYMAYPQGRPAPNLVAYSPVGEHLWTADNLGASGETNAYVSFLSENPLVVWNFECFRCTIDPQTGRLLESEFIK